MAKNTGKNYRHGSVNNRVQFKDKFRKNYWVKINATTGKLVEKKLGDPFKGVAKAKDHRRN